ncbi:putative WEB family protein [Hibiscus syriacus]|uniref:WEB family protein n=1 Tax=Hibiscus syriacus TaxID=106335 RepID=A0A6A2ZJ11_HIBSY|nr:putative WEB family protein [Hibiscus syriacus]
MSAKSKSGLSETPSKASPATPRVASKLSKGLTKSEPDSPSPLHSTRHSIDRRSSLNSKPSIDRKSPKAAAPAEKPQTRVSKGSELQAQLNSKAAEEANEKLREAVVAQKRAEESSEIEKFRALELEQAGIEAARKKDAEWEKEIESMKNQHTLDVAALLSTTEELQKVKQELSAICDAKNQALVHADDATKIAETHAEKVEILSAELAEIESLKQQLENAKIYKEKLMEKEAVVEQLNLELEAARMAESYAHNVLGECKRRVEELEMQIEEAKKLEQSASESLESVMKQLENNNDSLHDAESEIAALKEKVGLLEMTVSRQRGDLEESETHIIKAKEETAEAEKLVESLKSELETMKEEKIQALDNEKLAASSVQTLLEKKNKLITDLENSRDEEEKSKKAMESLASALHEVSAEAREAKEKLLSIEAEHGHYETQLEDLRLVLKAKNEKYETMLDDAKNEIDLLKNTIERSKNEYQNLKTEWEQKELHLVDCVKKSEEENSSLEKEINRLVNLLKRSEEEASASKEEEAQLKESLKEAESELVYLQEALKEAKTESMKLKDSLLDKETEMQSVVQENEELRAGEVASLKKIEELSKLLEEATIKSKMGKMREWKLNHDETKGKEDDSVEVEFKMWESCKIETKEFSPGREPEQESFDEEVESKVESIEAERLDQ